MKDKIKISIIVGTRPNLIKISPLIRNIKNDKGIEMQFINTGQHYDYELDEIFIKELDLPTPIFLDVGSGNPGEQTGKALMKIEKKLIEFNPDVSIVIGDTNSTLAGALASVKLHIPVAHIEAGLRSFDRKMPEEINRVIIDHISDVLFAPTKNAIKNLRNEGIPHERIIFVQDISVDVYLQSCEIAKKSQILKKIGINDNDNKYIFVTLHRQENVDNEENLCNILDALLEISKTYKVIFPIHPRTLKNLKLFGIFDIYSKNINFINPVGYFDFLKLASSASCIVTDSGGVQKEALIMKIPCVTTRTTTEWIETINLGANVLVGTNKENIINEVLKRSSEEFHNFMKKIGGKNPYGNGKTAEKIIKYIKKYLKKRIKNT